MSEQVQEDPIRIDPGYVLPYGTPVRWSDEQSGVLRDAIQAFMGYGAGTNDLPTFKQVAYVAAYLRYVIDAPCWLGGKDLEDLRTRAEQIASSPKRSVIGEWCDEINEWILDCLEIGIDPL